VNFKRPDSDTDSVDRVELHFNTQTRRTPTVSDGSPNKANPDRKGAGDE